ncbi:MAG: fructosamine kinase [Gordonia sp.]|jgi:fructosamine-3-kinase|uniref:fructosamine kinase family protein n=1 Tax=Gordonia sp. (in: high G+C Gram-positive bacteria) TaxID=84139 RepID=UPI000C3B6487|nr:fructosamine kinase family protein [Gordonia sp. (in: high G+C Gram-positive bacteria)]MAU80941.1 fructosamine kinase [Gordonia sp. (in: high G+C Gram-positive bacteria)]
MPTTHRKQRTDVDRDFFRAEAAGLRWLREGGGPVVDVLDVGDDFIALAHLDSSPPTVHAAREFGAALAGMHDAGAPRFGTPPAGHTGKQYIGERRLSSHTHDRWGEFYAAERVLPYLAPAIDAGNLRSDDAAATRHACELIAAGAFDDTDPPARIHGDLWNGNVIWTSSGVVLIDPAAHGGHRETDLAMLALFGCPHLDVVITGYQDTHALRPGWEQRVPLHQLHPLAVHAAGHGPSYGSALGRAARTCVALAQRAR